MGGGGKTPELPPTPAPTPMPQQPSSVSPIATEGQRSLRVAQMKKGILSTIKTSPEGISKISPDLTTQNLTGRKTLGGA